MTAGPGLLITFEGVDKAGKTTQVRRLAAFLRDMGIDPVITREPGGTPLAEELRRLVVSGSEDMDMLPLTETLLMAAARAEHVAKVLLPALAQGRVVLCDRFIDSTVAYQGYGLGVDMELIHRLNRVTTQERFPDLTFLLDVSPEDTAARGTAAGNDRIERRDGDFHSRVRRGFLAEAAQSRNRDRVVVVDGAAAEEAVARRIQETLLSRFGTLLKGDSR